MLASSHTDLSLLKIIHAQTHSQPPSVVPNFLEEDPLFEEGLNKLVFDAEYPPRTVEAFSSCLGRQSSSFVSGPPNVYHCLLHLKRADCLKGIYLCLFGHNWWIFGWFPGWCHLLDVRWRQGNSQPPSVVPNFLKQGPLFEEGLNKLVFDAEYPLRTVEAFSSCHGRRQSSSFGSGPPNVYHCLLHLKRADCLKGIYLCLFGHNWWIFSWYQDRCHLLDVRWETG